MWGGLAQRRNITADHAAHRGGSEGKAKLGKDEFSRTPLEALIENRTGKGGTENRCGARNVTGKTESGGRDEGFDVKKKTRFRRRGGVGWKRSKRPYARESDGRIAALKVERKIEAEKKIGSPSNIEQELERTLTANPIDLCGGVADKNGEQTLWTTLAPL